MATLASWYEDETEAGSHGSAEGKESRSTGDPHRLRAFPGEDVCFWVKTIDNSKVVRPADPQLLEACWRFISVASLVVILVVGLLLPHAYGMLAGYKLHKLQKEHETLLREREALELDETRLLSPQRLEELAALQAYVDPPPEKVVYLGPQDDRSLAMNAARKTSVAVSSATAPAAAADEQ
jgi:hypothetical protein